MTHDYNGHVPTPEDTELACDPDPNAFYKALGYVEGDVAQALQVGIAMDDARAGEEVEVGLRPCLPKPPSTRGFYATVSPPKLVTNSTFDRSTLESGQTHLVHPVSVEEVLRSVTETYDKTVADALAFKHRLCDKLGMTYEEPNEAIVSEVGLYVEHCRAAKDKLRDIRTILDHLNRTPGGTNVGISRIRLVLDR